jgi:putative transposase
VLTGDGPLRVEIPRDRDGSFNPILIPKHERRFTGFDDTIIAMYARGMTMREIQGFLLESYAVNASPSADTAALGARAAALRSSAAIPGWSAR